MSFSDSRQAALEYDAQRAVGAQRFQIQHGPAGSDLERSVNSPECVNITPDESIDLARLAQSPIKLFITATNVRTGRGRIFRCGEITADVLLASACLPTMFQAIEIDGDAYWDGGYAGNPTITPLIRESDAQDTILVQINPRERPGTPRSASACP